MASKNRSNFSPTALKESKAQDKKRRYGDKVRRTGATPINWKTMSEPIMSKPIEGKVVVRQYGKGAESYRTLGGNDYYDDIGVESVFEVGDDGTLRPSGELPRVIKFVRSKMPSSFKPGSLPENWTPYDMFRKEWAEMVKDKDKDLPPIDQMPVFSSRQVTDDPTNEFAEYDRKHADVGQTLGRRATPLTDEERKRLKHGGGSTVWKGSSGGTTLSDANYKNFIKHNSNRIISQYNTNNTVRNIAGSLSRGFNGF